MHTTRRSPHPLVLALLLGLVATLAPAPPAHAARSIYVATNGSDSNPGTRAEPYRTIKWGAARAEPGDTVFVRGGTYVEGAGGAATPARRDAPITLRNQPGERVVLKGALRLTNADWWIVDGINVTDDPTRTPGSLVAFNGGSNWILRNSEIWGGRSTANLLIQDNNGDPAENFRVTNNCIRDADSTGTFPTRHNIYLFNGLDSAGGIIERNILFDAPRGGNIKLGSGRGGDGRGAARVTVRFNTMASAATGVIMFEENSSNTVSRNLITDHSGGDQPYDSPTAGISTDGSTNKVVENAWHDHPVSFRDENSVGGAFKVAEHRKVSTGFDRTGACDGYRPTGDTARLYGRWAQNKPLPDMAPQFTDTGSSVFESDIRWLAAEEITAGCNPPTNDRFCPDDAVTRGQMAAFLVRALDLEASSSDQFRDDDTSVFENNIQSLAAADITAGCNPPTNDRFCPDDVVTRGQMAAFLRRAIG